LTLGEQSEAIAQRQLVGSQDRLHSEASDRLASWTITGVGVIATIALVPWLGASIFQDEGASLYSARLSWSDLWAETQHQDLVLLPYYVLLHFWLLVSSSIEWARVPSLLAFGAVIILVGRIGLRVGGRWCGIITAVLAATNALLIGRALNARPYELSALTATLCAGFLVTWLKDGRRSRLWLFCLFGVATALLQIFALLAPMAMVFMVLLVRPRRLSERVRAMAAPIGTMVLLSVAFVAVTARQRGQISWIASIPFGTRLENARGPAIGNLYDFVLFVVAIVAALILYYLWDQGGRSTGSELLNRYRDHLALSFGWAVLPTLLLVCVSVFDPLFVSRYATASSPGLALLFGLVLGRIVQLVQVRDSTSTRQEHRGVLAKGVAAFGVVVLVMLAVSFWTAGSVVNEDLPGLARYVSENARPGDAIVLYNHALTTGVEYYLGRDGQKVPLWPEVGARQPYPDGLDLVLHPGSSFTLPHRLWVVDDGTGLSKFRNTFLNPHYTAVEYHQFVDISVWLYVRHLY
jgi:mannosyltransferase